MGREMDCRSRALHYTPSLVRLLQDRLPWKVAIDFNSVVVMYKVSFGQAKQDNLCLGCGTKMKEKEEFKFLHNKKTQVVKICKDCKKNPKD